MKTSFDQFCINVSDLDASIHFYETVLGFTITHRLEQPGGMNVTEVLFEGENGFRLQIARHHDVTGPIDHGNALWKFYINTDDCEGLYQRCMEQGVESISAPVRLDGWPVTAAFVADPDGYQVEILEHHAETPPMNES
ncbi:MAG: VOC family protein [Pseudomonadales bacterium]|jgi:catechol 2,3-dioxygenase-like lactoylglutathione lyase family enzyme|nr:VOC family protein [Pseudomonadales bacterium]